MKIITTAFFSRLILQKYLSKRQWCSLFILMLGVILVQCSSGKMVKTTDNKIIGLIAIVASSLSSGFSGVYFEKLIKQNKSQSLWIRNLQLSILSCLFGSLTIIYNDYDNVTRNGFFYVRIKFFKIINTVLLSSYKNRAIIH